MADGLYVSMCGAAARQEQLDAIADNLANAQTPGFKAARPAFAAFLPASGAEDKVYPAAVASGFDLRAGPTVATGNALDVLPEDGASMPRELLDRARHCRARSRPPCRTALQRTRPRRNRLTMASSTIAPISAVTR